MAVQRSQFERPAILGGATLLVFAMAASAQQKSRVSTESPASLPLSTQVVPNKDLGFMREAPRKVRWKGQEFDVNTGIDRLMRAVKDPRTKPDERALALRCLGNLTTNLRNAPCIDELIAVYPTLNTTDEQYELLLCFIGSEDSRALPLAYDVAVGDAESRLRLRAAAALAQWNIRRGVEVLISLFSSREPGTMRPRGVDALILFKRFNRTNGWLCAVEELEAPAIALADQDEREAVALLTRRYRDWFEQNKNRFPDWKPGDSLPPNEPVPEDVAAAKGWKCNQTCHSPGDTDDCAACCVSHGACVTCCAVSFPRAKPAECRFRCELVFPPEKGTGLNR